MIKTGNSAVNIYTEITPNPETLKFVANKILYPGKSIEITKSKNAAASPLAQELFTFPFVESIFIASNFATVTKKKDSTWEAITLPIKEMLKEYLQEGKPVILEERIKNESAAPAADESSVVTRILEILDNYVKPAVEMDGGAIQLRKYEDGKVYVTLQGSCSGCPSSTITLKAGIETMMKRMIPEVKEVIAD